MEEQERRARVALVECLQRHGWPLDCHLLWLYIGRLEPEGLYMFETRGGQSLEFDDAGQPWYFDEQRKEWRVLSLHRAMYDALAMPFRCS